MLSHSSHLIQSVESLFSSNHFNGVSFEWALTHRSFPRILPDSSYFPEAIFKFLFEVWRKNELSLVKCFSPRSFKFFSSLAQLFHSSFRSASIIIGGVSRRHSRILKTEEDFSLNPATFSSRFMVLACSHPLIIVFDCENLFHPSGVIQESSQFDYSEPIISELFIPAFSSRSLKSYQCIAQTSSNQFMIFLFSCI